MSFQKYLEGYVRNNYNAFFIKRFKVNGFLWLKSATIKRHKDYNFIIY